MDGWLDNLTGWGTCGSLIVFMAVSLFRGWVVPKSTHERELKASDKRGDEWKESTMQARDLAQKLVESNEIVKKYREGQEKDPV